MNILTLSIGRHILREESNDRRRMQLYAEHLDAFHIVVLSRREHGYSDAVHESRLHIYPTNSTSRFMMLIDAFRIGRKILRTEIHPCVISAQDPFEIGFVSYILARVSGARFHVQLHGDYFDSLWRGASILRTMRLFLARYLLTRACGIRVVSERIKKSLIHRHVHGSKIAVLPIRPNLEVFLNQKHTAHENGALRFITVSRLAPEKNIPLMLRAFARCIKKYPNITLRIVGGGEEEQKISTLISELNLQNTVTMIPWSDDVPSEMGKADVFLLASDHEAYGLVLIEALAAGLPVVTTDVGCAGEVVQNGIHGFVVPPRDESLYCDALEMFASNSAPRKEMSEAGKTTTRTLQNVSETAYAKAWVAAHSCNTDRV